MTKHEIDEMPVTACKFCKSLHIENDPEENDICMKCGAVNEIEIYDNIDSYLKRNEKHKDS